MDPIVTTTLLKESCGIPVPIHPHSHPIVMIPLKRLLNEEATEERQFTRNKEYRSSLDQR